MNKLQARLTARLMEIEEKANEARAKANDVLASFNRMLSRTDSPRRLAFVAQFLVGGKAVAQANLYRGHERVAGLLKQGVDRSDLYYEQYDPEVRQRFTIGHELGHFFLHPGPDTVRTRCLPGLVDPEEESESSAPLDDEQEADAFSGAFLMPADELRADVDHFGRGIQFLAERYLVSERAMKRRLQTLELLFGEDRAPV